MKILKALFSRTTFMILMVVLEVLIIASVFHWFGEQAAWIAEVLRFLSGLIVLVIINNSRHLSQDMLWIVAIMMLPIPATAVYLLLGADMLASRTTWSLITSTNDAKKYYQQDPEVLEELNRKDPQKK
jgi:cardiolipin synthase